MSDSPMLFDVSTSEDSPKKKLARAAGRTPSGATQESEKTPSFIGESPRARVIRPVGRIDDTYRCIDDRCQAMCHDILLEEAGMWFLACCYCNCTQWLRAIPGVVTPREEQFQLRDGRFAGMTLDEVHRKPHGPEFIVWAAKSHQRQAVRAACKSWLDQRNAPA